MKLFKYIGKSKYATIEQIFFTGAMALNKAKEMALEGFTEYEIVTINSDCF